MTKLIFLIFIGAAAAPCVRAEDLKDSHRDLMDFCHQFVINEPDSAVHFGHHDCNFYDRDDPWAELFRR